MRHGRVGLRPNSRGTMGLEVRGLERRIAQNRWTQAAVRWVLFPGVATIYALAIRRGVQVGGSWWTGVAILTLGLALVAWLVRAYNQRLRADLRALERAGPGLPVNNHEA